MIDTIAGIIVTVLFMGFMLYRLTLSFFPIVDWLMDAPKYVRGI